jgi:hypothetical protein
VTDYSVHKQPENGHSASDNLIAERALRGVAIGRRNFLFAGADSGGERAAAMYSLVGSARLNGIDPEAYLHYVIERIADHPANRIDELLPWNVAPLLPVASHRSPSLAADPLARQRNPRRCRSNAYQKTASALIAQYACARLNLVRRRI